MIETIRLRMRVVSTLFTTRVLLTFCIAFSSTMPAQAHGPGHDNIKNITDQISEQGDSPRLYIKRARLFQDNQQWLEAMSDFNKAAELNPEDANIDLDRARLTYASKEYQRALDFINLYLIRHANTTEALLIKARSYRQLEQYQQAANFFKLALSDLSTIDGRPSPEWYVELANTYAITGDKHKALQAYQQGIKQLGPISVFQVKAIELEVDLELYNPALNRVDQLLRQSQRKDIWLSRRADILSKMGRQEEAQQTYQQAYVSLQHLPQRLRNLSVSKELEKKLRPHITSQ